MVQVILKMDKHGHGLEIDQSHLGRVRSLGDVFTEDTFRYMCILSGCDYLSSLHGIGLVKACKLLRLAKEPDILKVRDASVSVAVPCFLLSSFFFRRFNGTVFPPVSDL